MSLFKAAPSSATQARPIFRSGDSKYGIKFDVVLLDSKPLFVNTHYTRGRTYPCTKANGRKCMDCDGEKPEPIRERAYIGAVHPQRKLTGVLELTVKAGLELLEVSRTAELVGRHITIDREHGKKTRSLVLTIHDAQLPVQKYLLGWDTVAALCATWGIEDERVAKLHAPEVMERGQDEEDVWVNRQNGRAVAS